MRRLVVLGAAAAALLAGCSTGTQTPGPAPSTASSGQAPSSAVLPPDPKPAAAGPCPYLDTDFVARANGQHVGEVRLSADEPHPACFFYRPDGDVQLTVRVYVGDPEVATGLVDKAAPVDTSNPTEQPAGWTGGYESTGDGAVYAVAKEGKAVIVTTNQQQSVKARTVATQAISGLGI
ncbi:DUF2020 domain-containing protein [Prauserella muralis]|uniref:Uncharacterized protein n=1 Tax=Prauserella muralis TaxID=588067 RepID=A0A2V4B8N1_9PSEU|nr:DUF2020 domain-containing protein [Prauserella muralis]PXY31724.1 hypothetical protein BAY60_05065 [Prauserella muralis]TWE13891.1 uncharacterized protein DUF3558 [Prauserella muralis]